MAVADLPADLEDLTLAMPKPVTVYDYQVRLKVPMNLLEKAPQHFTNLHMGLQLARRILRKRTSENKQIFIITDGQPTAHVEGDFVHLLYPPDPKSTVATLKEAVGSWTMVSLSRFFQVQTISSPL